jgi:hypothetical protein
MPLEFSGTLSGHPLAGAFAREVFRVHRRYAVEIVAAFELCPFVRRGDDAAVAAFGRFAVVIDRELNRDAACRIALSSPGGVVHIVYPLVASTPSEFERFAARVGDELRKAMAPAQANVLAAFHPELSGDPRSADRLVGMLRRAPDPFVQLIPEGLHEGGTTFAGPATDLPVAPVRDPAEDNFERLRGGGLERVLALLADIHADRAHAYAPFLEALAPTKPP